ncbi:monofunctional biosynthetic peptidoglycan transglycosylase [Bacteroidota bacterium]
MSPIRQTPKYMSKKKSFIRFTRKWLTRLVVFFFASTIFFTLLYKWVPPPVTPLMIIRLFDQKAADKPLIFQKDWTRIENISDQMPLAVLVCEDQNFMKHHGFDLESIKKAQKHNEKNRRKRGASTITQQTAKNVFLWPQRSWFRKGLEVYFTALIEIFWSKKRIMEVYLNVIEMGDGIYGAEKASQIYFRKPAKKLSRYEAALIAVCLPNPIKMKPTSLTSYRLRRQAWAVRQMSYFYPLEFDKKKEKKKEK